MLSTLLVHGLFLVPQLGTAIHAATVRLAEAAAVSCVATPAKTHCAWTIDSHFHL